MPKWLLVVGCLLYALSPLDLVPDVIPLVGWLDDIGVLGYLSYTLLNPPQSESQTNE